MKKVILELALEQAQAVREALDLRTRLGLGQVREIVQLLRDGSIPFGEGVHLGGEIADRLDAIEDLLKGVADQMGFLPNGSYGIGHQAVPIAARRAYEIEKVLDKALAEDEDPTPKMRGVHYDGLGPRYTQDPAPSARVVMTSDRPQLGSAVRWMSQAGGYRKTKEGVVVLVVPAGEPLTRLKDRLPGLPGLESAGMSRKHESYVVQVGKRLYWPVASRLQVVGAGDAAGLHHG